MSKAILSLLFSIVLFSCSFNWKITKSVPANVENTIPSPSTDGSFYRNAIVIDAKSETTGVSKEYDWLKKSTQAIEPWASLLKITMVNRLML